MMNSDQWIFFLAAPSGDTSNHGDSVVQVGPIWLHTSVVKLAFRVRTSLKQITLECRRNCSFRSVRIIRASTSRRLVGRSKVFFQLSSKYKIPNFEASSSSGLARYKLLLRCATASHSFLVHLAADCTSCSLLNAIQLLGEVDSAVYVMPTCALTLISLR